MGNLTAKTSGEIASFMTPAKTNIKSLKVHFSPKQLGTGDPSPENVREIEGWNGVEVAKSSVNLLDQSYITEASGWILSSDDGNTMYCGVPVYKGNVNKFYTKFKSSYPFIGNPFKENVQYNVSVWLKTVSGNSLQGLKFGFKYTDGTSSLGGIFAVNDTWKRQTVTSKANKTVSNIYCTYNNSGEIYLCGLAVCEKEFDDINIVHSSTTNDISYQWKKLPDEYQEVEYIENTGTQYLLTDFIFRKDLENPKIEWKHMQIVDPSYNNMLFGYTANGGAVYFEYYGGARGYSGIGGIRYANISYPSSLGLNEIAICSMDKEKLILNGVEFNPNGAYTDLTTVNPMSIFAWTNTNGINVRYINKGTRIYYLRFYNGDTKMADFIPCYRKSDNEIGMYDIVSQTFYTNQGTGEFLKGEDVFCDTAYGGYIDLISGELVEEWNRIILDGTETWSNPDNGFLTEKYNNSPSYPDGVCSTYVVAKNYTQVNGTNKRIAITSTGVRLHDSQFVNITSLKTYLQSNNIYFCYKTNEPITHQLTPTQLQSFVGQNNFWSNADYVEVEYDLIETEDIQKCRKKIILNQPQLKTISDKVVSFNTDMVAPMKNCKIYFKPIQSGSGDPSSTNVRDINGWTGVDSYVNGDKISVDWTSDVGTVYGGYLDLAKKEVVAEWECNQLTSAQLESYECGYSSNVSYFNTSAVWIRNWNYKKIGAIISGGMDGLCNMFPISIHNKNIYASQYRIYFKVPNTITSLEDFKISIQNAENNNNGLFVAYKLATPIHYPLSSLTSQQLLTLKSTNHIWSETNGQQIDVTYWTCKNLTPTSLTNYLENQTWVDSAYISSSGKKTTNTVSASHFLTNQILLEAGTYVLSGFSHYVGTDNTNYRIHAYDSTGTWLRQITYKQIGNLSPVDISFTLDTDTYVNVSIAADFDGVLAKIN